MAEEEKEENQNPKKSRKLNPSHPQSSLTLIIPTPLSTPSEITKSLHHLQSSDPNLIPLIQTLPSPTFTSNHPPFLSLTKSILYQQLSSKAGSSIYNKLVSLCNGESSLLPETVLNLSIHQLRQIGVSGRKASYLHDLAVKFRDGVLKEESIVEMDDESLIRMLTVVKGIGIWSVHMFMIFVLRRPDVLPVGDLGVRKGVKILYGLGELPI